MNSMTETFTDVTIICTNELWEIRSFTLVRNAKDNKIWMDEKDYDDTYGKKITSFIPVHKRKATIRTNTAAHGSTTIPTPGMVWRAKNEGNLSKPPKNKAWFQSKKQKDHMVSINIGDLPHCLLEKLLKLNGQITSKHMIICNKHHELKQIQTSLLHEYTIILLCSIVNYF